MEILSICHIFKRSGIYHQISIQIIRTLQYNSLRFYSCQKVISRSELKASVSELLLLKDAESNCEIQLKYYVTFAAWLNRANMR